MFINQNTKLSYYGNYRFDYYWYLGRLPGRENIEREWIRVDCKSDSRYYRWCIGRMAIRPAGTKCKRSDRQPGDVNHRRNRFTMDRFTIQKRISSFEN